MSEETIFNASGRRMVRAVAATSSGLSTTRSTGDATPILPSKALAEASLNEVPAAILGISAGTSTVLAGRSKASAISRSAASHRTARTGTSTTKYHASPHHLAASGEQTTKNRK